MYKDKTKKKWKLATQQWNKIKKNNNESTFKITQTKEHTPTFYKYYALHINEYIVIIAGYMY